MAVAEGDNGVLIDNRTDLPDQVVEQAVLDHFVESSSLSGIAHASTFQSYAAEGSMLARSKFKTPGSVYDEIILARDLAERDDDVRATIGMMISVAFADGMENHHPDEATVRLFNGLARHMNLDGVLKRLYREWLIAQQVTTVSLFQRRQQVDVGNEGDSEAMVAPVIGILPAEKLRTIGSNVFGTAELALIPDGKLATWLQAYFDESTSPARKAELRRQDPVSAVMFTGPVSLDADDYTNVPTRAYRLNPRMVHRTTAPHDGEAPRPLLTANFALLEAKRLLNLMDYALLQGGMNFIVVAKKGTDERPAMPQEVDNLEQVVRRASRTGVIVGDHRLSFEIITPELTELLNADKRQLLGRKIAMTLLRIPEQVTHNPAAAGMQAELEFLARVIASDRQDLRRHVENHVYEECLQRNRALTSGTPRLWFPKIVLQGTNYFTDYVLKLRDRGDIPRKWAVEAAGFDWEAGVEQRKSELADDVDETMAPAAVPFSNPGQPQDNNSGRPTGTSTNNGRGTQTPQPRDNVRPLRTINRNAGETVRAVLDEATGETRRVGERTLAILEEYADYQLGRITALEREALHAREPFITGPLAIIPVNPAHVAVDVKALRLAPGLSMLVGERKDGALVAKALCFRQPEFDVLDAEETALKWGFPIEGWDRLDDEHAAQPDRAVSGPPTIVVERPVLTEKVVERDEHNNIVRVREVPVQDAEDYAKGGVQKGKYVYLRCPTCGLIQDAAHDKCTRCKTDLAPARRAMFAQLNQRGEKPTLHDKPPPPPSKQPDIRKKGNS